MSTIQVLGIAERSSLRRLTAQAPPAAGRRPARGSARPGSRHLVQVLGGKVEVTGTSYAPGGLPSDKRLSDRQFLLLAQSNASGHRSAPAAGWSDSRSASLDPRAAIRAASSAPTTAPDDRTNRPGRFIPSATREPEVRHSKFPPTDAPRRNPVTQPGVRHQWIPSATSEASAFTKTSPRTSSDAPGSAAGRAPDGPLQKIVSRARAGSAWRPRRC